MNARKAALLAVFAAVAAAFFLLDLGRYLSLESLKSNRAALEALRDRHALLFPALFTLVYVFQTAFSLPGAAILSLAAGALFGLVQGTLLAVTGATVGAILAFWVSRTLLRDWAVKKLKGRMEAVDRGLREKGLSYLLFLRWSRCSPSSSSTWRAASRGSPCAPTRWERSSGSSRGARCT
jgi:uncharacterized membrane protein YdjX (TVP38/TMEM64 family)